MLKLRSILFAVLVIGSSAAKADGIDEILNYREYGPYFASSGQPSPAQLGLLKAAGYERVIYIAFSDQERAIPGEDRVVKTLGMDYVHVPVDWEHPKSEDFYVFADTMQRSPNKRTLLHCQVNARASAFSFLYLVLYEDVPVADAKAVLNSVWQPNAVWRDFIFLVLAQNDVSPNCEGCDWTPPPPSEH